MGYAAGATEALAALWLADGDLYTLAGGILRGRGAVADFFERTLKGPYRGSRFSLTLQSIRKLRPNLVVVDGRWSISGPDLPPNYPASGLRLNTQILERTPQGELRIVSARPAVPTRGHTRNLGR
ncbi:MAG: SgcJ/EcaC family oxidoreductase [Deltaproteobacteria bacterium]|nr:SgcJ/EcaC family oxidoreductase [Deltaproteobacteria bacterium]